MPPVKSDFGIWGKDATGHIEMYMNGKIVRVKNFRDRDECRQIMQEWTREIERLRNKKHEYFFSINLNL